MAVERCDAVAFVARAIDVMVAMRAGDLVVAERLAEDCFCAGATAGDADAEAWYGAQLLAIRWMQGRSAELLDAGPRPRPGADGARAQRLVRRGDGERRRRRRRARPGPSGAGRLRAGGLRDGRLAELLAGDAGGGGRCGARVGDAELAAEVGALLAPFAELPVMASLAVACFGSAHHPLGIAAMAAGDVDAAIAHFEAAVAANLRLGNVPCHVDRHGRAGRGARTSAVAPATWPAPRRCGPRRSTRPSGSG